MRHNRAAANLKEHFIHFRPHASSLTGSNNNCGNHAGKLVAPSRVLKPKSHLLSIGNPSNAHLMLNSMRLIFQIRFRTQTGQSLFLSGNHDLLGGDEPLRALPMKYLNQEFWQLTLDWPAP